MPQYIINRNKDEKGLNEVHNLNCYKLPNTQNRIPLGSYIDEVQAVLAAKHQGFLTADGCKICCPKAHHG